MLQGCYGFLYKSKKRVNEIRKLQRDGLGTVDTQSISFYADRKCTDCTVMGFTAFLINQGIQWGDKGYLPLPFQ